MAVSVLLEDFFETLMKLLLFNVLLRLIGASLVLCADICAGIMLKVGNNHHLSKSMLTVCFEIFYWSK